MIAVVSLLVVIVVSLLVVRIATVALSLTGLSRQSARFQARSAFTGSGFTTSESESVVQHPVRRRIIMLLMLVGNAGIVTAITSLVLSFVTTDEAAGVSGAMWFRVLALIVGLTALWMAAYSSWIDQRLSRWIARALKTWTDLEIRDYAGLLRLTGDYVVAELTVESDDWLAERSLRELKLADEGVLILGVERGDGSYIGAPRGDAVPSAGDTVLLYGREDVLSNLDQRRSGPEGNWEHHKAIDSQISAERDDISDTNLT